MKTRLSGLCLFLTLLLPVHAQAQSIERPRLVVGIVVDQMRYDYLYRYWDVYGQGGLKRLVQKGYSFEQAFYPYAPTVTGPGHASIYTGSTPAYHGIAENYWRNRAANKAVYCTDDSTVTTVGAEGKAGKMSPRNLLSSTIGDELKFASRGRGKVISISMKDRGAILPAGHRADAAYWFDSKSGYWISSTYYQKALPAWAADFNQKKSIVQYVRMPWQPLLTPAEYLRWAGEDSSRFEGEVAPGMGSRMPVDMAKAFANSDYGAVFNSGFGINATTDFALTALAAEKLGQRRDETDLLCLSYSSTDAVGHNFGPDSWEVMDTYLRLDRDLERLLSALDKQVGKDNYLVFLSADHGVAQVQGIAQEQKLPGGRYSLKETVDFVSARMVERYGPGDWVEGAQAEQIYLNRALLKANRISIDEAAAVAAEFIRQLPWVHNAWASWALRSGAVADPFARRYALGCHPDRSGDVFIQAKSGYISHGKTGTTHSSGYSYDTHVPMLFYGWHVAHGQTLEPAEITDIAPTVCAMLHIQMPSATIGRARSMKKE